MLILCVRISGDWGPSLAFFDLRQKCPQHKTSAFRYEVNHYVSSTAAAAAAYLSPSDLHLRFHHANRNRRPVQGALSFSPISFFSANFQARAQFFWQATPVTIGTFSKWEDAVVSQLPSALSDVSRFVIANGFALLCFQLSHASHHLHERHVHARSMLFTGGARCWATGDNRLRVVSSTTFSVPAPILFTFDCRQRQKC